MLKKSDIKNYIKVHILLEHNTNLILMKALIKINVSAAGNEQYNCTNRCLLIDIAVL